MSLVWSVFKKSWIGVLLVCLWGAETFAQTDYYTAGFFTRAADAALYMDQGGVLDPFYIPVRHWALLPRVTVSATREDNFFLVGNNETAATSVHLVPGVMLIFGRPEHNHLYVDTGARFPLHESESTAGADYLITAGGVYRTGISSVHGRVGHRRTEGADMSVGGRISRTDYIADIGMERRISTKTGLGVNAAAEWNDLGNNSFLNYNRFYVAGRIGHRLTAKSRWFTQAGVGWDRLDEAKTGVYSSGRFHDLSVGIQGKLTPKTSASGRVGYQWKTFDDGSIPDVSSWIASVGANASPFGLSRFYTELTAGIRPDITRAGDTMIDKRCRLGVGRRIFSEKVRGDASVLYGNVEYYGPGTQSDFDYWGFRLWLDYWTRWNLSFGSGYSYEERLGPGGFKAGTFSLRASWNY